MEINWKWCELVTQYLRGEAGGSGVRGRPRLHRECEARPGSWRPFLRKQKGMQSEVVLMIHGISEESSIGDWKNDHPYSEMVKNTAELSACPWKGWKSVFRGEHQSTSVAEQLSDEMDGGSKEVRCYSVGQCENDLRAGATTQRLRALVVLPEYPVSIPGTHIMAHKYL